MALAFGRWAYRVTQFGKALREPNDLPSREMLAGHLDERGRALFHRMSPRDQAHCWKTAAILERRSAATNDLVVAALLHDVGKERQAVWQRILYVLLTAIDPRIVRRLSRPCGGTRGALYRSLNHPSLGAAMAAEIGASPGVQHLIQGHHEMPRTTDEIALSAADEIA